VKGQYFSFDAVVASVIMVIAVTSLVAYWFGVQSVAESRSNDMYADSLRMAESLLSPGSPSNWTAYVTANPDDLNQIHQIGLEENSSGELDQNKITALENLAAYPSSATSPPPSYTAVGNIMHATGDYYIRIRQTDGGLNYSIGRPPAENASEVIIAHRGAVLDSAGTAVPVSMTVYLWRQ
jgi:hypothetical protein